MKLVKLEQAQEFSNSDKCKGLEYPLEDTDINFSIAKIQGRYPDSSYCVNEVCKELIYVIEGNGSLNKKDEKIEFKKGDVILIEKGEVYFWNAHCTIAISCTPAWYSEQHKLIEK